MSDELNRVYRSIDEQHAEKSALTRRRLVKGTAATLGGMGLLSLPFASSASAAHEDPQTILNVAATAEVLATIVNSVGQARVDLQPEARRNIRAAAREEYIHFQTLTEFGATPLTRRIWVPDAVFASRTSFLDTLEVGDQVFVNAYLIATRVFGNTGNGQLATIASEFMGVEAVHRAFARHFNGKLGNDRVFMKSSQEETAPGAPDRGRPGFDNILEAPARLQAAGFGFGQQGSQPGQFYNFDVIKDSVPTETGVNTLRPVA